MLPLTAMLLASGQTEPGTSVFPPGPAKANGKRVVLLSGDEEYRSEEALPQLARILSRQHGFHCTVVFSMGPDGNVDPETTTNQPGIAALDRADLCIMMLRFRCWPDAQMEHFQRYLTSGRPIIALRTSTHAFNYPKSSLSPFAHMGWNSPSGGFGKSILGETWLSHWGNHGAQGTRAIPTGKASGHPVTNGVRQVFVTTDVYEAHPPAEATVLLQGMVTTTLSPDSPPAEGFKTTVKGVIQAINDPMMPVLWVMTNPTGSHKPEKVTVTTMGSATDLLDEGMRRVLVNATFWSVGLAAPKVDNVPLAHPYNPSPYGFKRHKTGQSPTDF